MKYLIGLLIPFLFLLSSERIFAEINKDDIINKIEACITSKNPKSITEYTCTKGDMLESGEPISDEKIAYIVVMSIRFQEIDTTALEDMKILQKQRLTNEQSWIATIRELTQNYTTQYQNVCTALGGDLNIIAKWKNKTRSTPTIDAFPQTLCNDLALKKATAWKNMGYMLASGGIAKGVQNSKDIHINTVKGKYGKLLERISSYERIIATAVQKFTAYIRDPIQG